MFATRQPTRSPIKGSGNKGEVANRKDREKRGKSGQRRGKRGAEKLIERFDSDGDGKLAVSELPERMQKRFAKVDADEDGFVSAAELKTAFENRVEKEKGNRDGADKGSRKNEKQDQRKIDPAKFMQRLDQDGNEKISLTEAPKRLQAGFSRADSNGDGFVDLAELTIVVENFKGMQNGKSRSDQQGKRKRDKNDDLKPITPKTPPIQDFKL